MAAGAWQKTQVLSTASTHLLPCRGQPGLKQLYTGGCITSTLPMGQQRHCGGLLLSDFNPLPCRGSDIHRCYHVCWRYQEDFQSTLPLLGAASSVYNDVLYYGVPLHLPAERPYMFHMLLLTDSSHSPWSILDSVTIGVSNHAPMGAYILLSISLLTNSTSRSPCREQPQ